MNDYMDKMVGGLGMIVTPHPEGPYPYGYEKVRASILINDEYYATDPTPKLKELKDKFLRRYQTLTVRNPYKNVPTATVAPGTGAFCVHGTVENIPVRLTISYSGYDQGHVLVLDAHLVEL
jgi:hypothetical protein